MNYGKTNRGRDALANRSAALTAKLRPLLLLVDGMKTHEELAELAGKLGLGSAQLEELEKLGFIAPGANAVDVDISRPPAFADDDEPTVRVASNAMDRFVQAQRFVRETLERAGVRQSSIATGVEQAATMQELSALYEGFVALLESTTTDAASAAARLRAMLI